MISGTEKVKTDEVLRRVGKDLGKANEFFGGHDEARLFGVFQKWRVKDQKVGKGRDGVRDKTTERDKGTG